MPRIPSRIPVGRDFAIPWIAVAQAGHRQLLFQIPGIPRELLRVPSRLRECRDSFLFRVFIPRHLPLKRESGKRRVFNAKTGAAFPGKTPAIPGLGNVPPPSLREGKTGSFPKNSLRCPSAPAKPFLEGLIPNPKSQIIPSKRNHAATPESSPGFLFQQGIPSCP